MFGKYKNILIKTIDVSNKHDLSFKWWKKVLKNELKYQKVIKITK